ncbi:hypothetical protein [Hymenobacter psychrotolerans]|uniref:Uncharacterized protein n=1 Tax=Hymenobacter psychrotolerans DSM 18569 TaxID=1121959 RepID=A0A1M6Z4T4_9BACT|nr:hypothetical protein [Hymenobacter psychrotolerans]SHL25345.1 hypothetical protein SAMN02746009_02419 [Hymenobacter psychrotolerans DSM 18569]
MSAELSDAGRPDAALLALRPVLPAVLPPSGNATPADFLHHTLRPVLKLQNDVLLAVVADFVRDHHIALAGASATEQHRLLAELLTRNTKLRYTVVGLICGLYTAAELAYYREHRSELNRRLLELATRRVQDQAATVVALTLAL